MTGLPTQSAENKFQTPFFKASIPAIRRKSQMDWLWNRFAPDFLQRGSFGEVCRNFQFLVNAFKPFHLHTSALYIILLLFCQMTLTQEYKEVNFDQVVAKWQKAVTENPSSVAAYMNLGFAYLAVDAMEQATDAFGNALNLDLKFPGGHYWLGRCYFLRRDFEQSIVSFQAAVELLPDWGEAYAELGLCYLQTHKYEEAEAAMVTALQLLASLEFHRYQFLPSREFGNMQEWLDKVAPLSQVDVAYYLSLIAFDRGLFDKSTKYCHQALLIEPKFAEAHFQLGLIHAQKQEWEATEHAFLKAIQMGSQMALAKLGRAHYQLSLLYFRQGKEAEARKEMELSQELNDTAEQFTEQRASLQRGEDQVSALANLGWLYLNNEKYEAAVREYKKALWHNPNLVEAYNGIGYAYAMLGRFSLALSAQQQALELDPQMAEAHAGLGLIQLKEAEISQSERGYEAALSALRQATTLNPNLADALLNLGNVATKLSRFQEAEEAYEKLLAIQPYLTKAYLALGQIYLHQEKYPQAIRRYQEALRQDPKLVEAYYNLGLIAFRLMMLDKAKQAFNAALKIQPNLIEAHYYLGEIYAQQKEFPLAEKAYQRVIQIQPSKASAYERLAKLYGRTELSQISKALQFARKAVELQPNSSTYLNTLSWLNYLNKDYVQAEEIMKRALMLQPNDLILQEGLQSIEQARAREGKKESERVEK